MPFPRRLFCWPALAAVLALVGQSIAAEREVEFRPRAYAFTSAHIVPVTFPEIEKGTILVRDGIIEAVGAEIPIPGDAVVLDCEGLTVYPGLLDPRTSLFTPSAKRKEKDAKPPPGYGHDLPELQPERRASDEMVLSKSELAKLRKLGFTAALMVPKGNVFLGSSALISLGEGAPNEQLIALQVSLHLNFQPERNDRTYPGSRMGAIAHIRQNLLDADHYGLELERFRRTHGRGFKRPAFDAALEALLPVVRQRLPVVFEVENWHWGARALELAKEFGVRPILAGLRDGYRIVDALAASGAEVILSVDYPQPPKDLDEEADYDSVFDLRERRDIPTTARLLHEQGIRFAFTTFGLANPADFPARVRRAMEAGLPHWAAVAASTIEPARILGVDEMLGSIEKGKIANLMVTDGKLFEKKTKVRFLVIDGRKIEVKESIAKGDPTAKMDFAGTWELTFETPGGKIPATMVISGDSGEYDGSITAMGTELPFLSVEVEGNAVTLTLSGDKVGMSGEIALEVVVAGDSLTGTFGMPDGESGNLSGVRTGTPDGRRG